MKQLNRWKGLVLGVIGSIPGMIAMDYYWKLIYSLPQSKESSQQQSSEGSQDSQQHEPPLYSISLFGKHYEKGESSTAAVGRMVYQMITGKEPQSEETRSMLSNLTDWGFGMLIGGTYGMLRGNAGVLNFEDDLIYSTGLWLVADETMVPLLGFSKGPAAYPLRIHLEGLGAHIAYGLATFTVTKLLYRIL